MNIVNAISRIRRSFSLPLLLGLASSIGVWAISYRHTFYWQLGDPLLNSSSQSLATHMSSGRFIFSFKKRGNWTRTPLLSSQCMSQHAVKWRMLGFEYEYHEFIVLFDHNNQKAQHGIQRPRRVCLGAIIENSPESTNNESKLKMSQSIQVISTGLIQVVIASASEWSFGLRIASVINLILGCLFAKLAFESLLQRVRRHRGLCVNCGYAHSSTISERCPECGSFHA